MGRSRTRPVVFQPAAYQGLQRGIHQIVRAVRPTLGPRSRMVAVTSPLDHKAPELLDNGGLIARRIIQLPNRDEDMGAMLVRQLLWRLQERFGDGTATAAVVFQSVYDQGLRHLAAGGNAMWLRHHLQQGQRVILGQLIRLTRPLTGRELLNHFAESICPDASLAPMLGEIFDVIGPDGQLEIRPGRSRELAREYFDGAYWPGGLLSRRMIADSSELKTHLENAALLITDLEIEDPHQLVPVFQAALRAGAQSLVIVANKLSERALALVLANCHNEKLRAIAVKTPGLCVDEQISALEDMAVYFGGQPRLKAAGQALSDVRPEDLGRAQQVWADCDYVGGVGAQNDSVALTHHTTRLRAALTQADDPALRQKLQQRLGKLTSGAATLWIGGATEVEIKTRQALAERTAEAIRGAIRQGVLPGGGAALLACRPALGARLRQSTDPDERAAFCILLKAMAEPTRVILANAGHDANGLLARLEQTKIGDGVDAHTGQMVDMVRAGILDSAAALKAAVLGAIHSAALALTIEVLVHHKQPHMTLMP